jgi:hypothetical protein
VCFLFAPKVLYDLPGPTKILIIFPGAVVWMWLSGPRLHELKFTPHYEALRGWILNPLGVQWWGLWEVVRST